MVRHRLMKDGLLTKHTSISQARNHFNSFSLNSAFFSQDVVNVGKSQVKKKITVGPKVTH